MANQRHERGQPKRSDSEPSGDRDRIGRVGREDPTTASEHTRRRERQPRAEESDLTESNEDQLMDERVIDDEMDERVRRDP